MCLELEEQARFAIRLPGDWQSLHASGPGGGDLNHGRPEAGLDPCIARFVRRSCPFRGQGRGIAGLAEQILARAERHSSGD
jgi:hypothetical protein